MSPDLVAWLDTGIVEPGTGSLVAYQLISNEERLFYCIRETSDPYNGGFLVLPTQNQEMDVIDGVCFAFNLNAFTALPAKIRLYEREYDNPNDQWEQIGLINDFDEIDSIKFVRGSVVWLPTVEDEYEVKAAALNDSGTVIATAVRRVIVGTNQGPTITITAGPATPSSSPQFAFFTAEVEDSEGDEIRRVEFYDNGVLIGTDAEGVETAVPDVIEYGDDIEDIEGNSYYLLRGTHNITAKVYDSRGGVGETTVPFVVSITGGNARPMIGVTSPQSGVIVTQGQNFTIVYDENDPDGASDVDEVKVYDIVTYEDEIDTTAPFSDLTFDTSGWEPGTHTLRLLARDNAGDASYPFYLTIFVRTGSGATFAESLVANIVDETSAAPSGEVFNGAQASSDEFEDGLDSVLEFDSGVILTTGLFANWNTGNRDDGDDFDVLWNTPGDLGLEDRVAGWGTKDAAALDFDVYCLNGQLEIEFQFGSEEYIEWVAEGTETGCYNDAFMLTVDGVFVALVPDCSDIVAVNSVHPAITVAESRCLFNGLEARNECLYLSDDDLDGLVQPGNEGVRVEYDGMTIRLRAHALVTPEEMHHIRLVIADVNDAQYDSALFVKEGSIRTVVPTP
jgi:hypothetical protein